MKDTPDGTSLYYIYTGQLLTDYQGQPIGVLQSFLDITERKEAEQKLRRALQEIDLLHRIMPICSYCKKVRDDAGCWLQVESYISDHSNLDFSHGICPQCLEKHFSDK
jgi:hypothetical protein